MDTIIETEGIGGRPLLCDHTGVSSKNREKTLDDTDVVRDVEKVAQRNAFSSASMPSPVFLSPFD